MGVCQEPLLFYACHYDGLHFRRAAQSHTATQLAIQRRIQRQLLSLGILVAMAEQLDSQQAEVKGAAKCKGEKHIKLLLRGCEPSVATRLLKLKLGPPSTGTCYEASCEREGYSI